MAGSIGDGRLSSGCVFRSPCTGEIPAMGHTHLWHSNKGLCCRMLQRTSDLILNNEEREILEKIEASRTEPYAKVIRTGIMLKYSEGLAINAIAVNFGTSRPLIERCIDKALSGGIEVALADLPRSGRPATISADDKTWVISIA
ncbi:MAG: hypothetical protein AB2L14_33775 [Candidatus Xenobiia bacterium LiM19]